MAKEEITNSLIDQLFENDHFKKKLNEHIYENLSIRIDRDSHTGESDEPIIKIGDRRIDIESKSYGY